MPIYEYKCRNCGRTFEFFVRSEKESIKCYSCDSKNLRKLVSVSNTASREKPELVEKAREAARGNPKLEKMLKAYGELKC